MVNIIEAQQLENKLLIAEKQLLEKQLAKKEGQIKQAEEGFKLKIWKALHKATNYSEKRSTHLMLLENFGWAEKGWISSKGFSILELNRYLERDRDERVFERYAVFSKDFTLENVFEDINQKMSEQEEFESVSLRVSQFFKSQLNEEIAELKKTIKELEAKQKELEETNKWFEREVAEGFKREDTHIETMWEVVGMAEKELGEKIDSLNDEIKTQSLMLQKSDKMLVEEIGKNTKLWEELEEKSKMLAKSEAREEELKRQSALERKPLPALPKEEDENKTLTKTFFKRIITKARVKVQQLQKLIKREKLHSQTLIAKIEVPIK